MMLNDYKNITSESVLTKHAKCQETHWADLHYPSVLDK